MGFKEHYSSHTQFLHCTLKSVLCLLLCTLQMHGDIWVVWKWSILLPLWDVIMSAKAGMVPTPSGTLGQKWELLVLIEGKNKNEPHLPKL